MLLSTADTYEPSDNDGMLGVSDLCRMFEEAEESSFTARQNAERDRDYYDGRQLTDAEIAELRKRGQPEVVINKIRRKINYLLGLEKQQRTMPRGLPRTPIHEMDANAATDSLRYVAEQQNFKGIRSAVWKNLLIEGAGACCVSVEPAAASQYALMATTAMTPAAQDFDVKLRYYAWDRFFADPHSSALDYADANYLGTVLWMDLSDAIAMYGDDNREVLEETLSEARNSGTYDDKPQWLVWGDFKRKRIRIVQIWVKRANEWYFAEFTKGGILKSGVSPYVSDDGKTDCEIIAASAYCDRDNNRYGEVRELISPQDEMNKRRSKALHILNTAQVIYEDGAVADVNDMQRQAVRPDGKIKLNAGMMDKFKFETRADLAQGQFQLLEVTSREMDFMGPNASMQGDQGKEASGRAVLASQQGGMVEMADLLDRLQDWDRRVFRAIWNRIRQYWTAPKWIRVTDDERNMRFAAINGAVSPDGRVGPSIAQLDVDIIIDDAPDGVAPQIEQFQSLVELKKFDANGEIPFRVILEAMPNLRNKDKLMDLLDKREQMAAQQPQQPPPELMRAQIDNQTKQAQIAAQTETDWRKAVLDALTKIEVARIGANTDADSALLEAQLERILQIGQHAHERQMQREQPQPATEAA